MPPVLTERIAHLPISGDYCGADFNPAHARLGSFAMGPSQPAACISWATGDQMGALRIAARLFDRSTDTRTFKRGMNAHNHPGFYRQLGKNPEQLTQAALELLAKKFSL